MLENVLGIQINYETWDKEKQLPFYITETYKTFMASIGNQKCIILMPTYELPTIPALKKQIKRIRQIEDFPVVLNIRTLSYYRRKSLIENGIPFIAEKQIYLPFIGTFLTNERKAEEIKVEKFTFSTQQLVLFYLYNKEPKLYISEATKKLPFTAMTMTRAVKQLETVDLFNVTKDGVNRVIESKYGRRELFERIKGYLSTPVCKKGYIDKSQITSDMVVAGETALSEKTMLNYGSIITYAVDRKLFNKNWLKNELLDPNNQVKVEVWAYSPQQFTNENRIDNLSLVLSFEKEADERIEEAIDEILEEEFGS